MVLEKLNCYLYMFKFSTKSEQLLNTVCKELNILAHEVIKISPIDFSITEGFRDRMKQKELYNECKSRTLKSKHCECKAIDIMCCKEGYKEPLRDIYIVIGLFLAKAKELNINIRVGALWDNNSTKNNNFIDAFHIELI